MRKGYYLLLALAVLLVASVMTAAGVTGGEQKALPKVETKGSAGEPWNPVTEVSRDDSGDGKSQQAAAVTLCLHLLAGPTDDALDAGYASRIPADTQLVDVEVTDAESAKVTIQFPGKNLSPGDYSDYTLSQIGEQFAKALECAGIRNLEMFALDPITGETLSFDDLIVPELGNPIVQDEGEDGPKTAPRTAVNELMGSIPLPNPGNITGSLTGKTIYLNQGHGWFDDVDFGRWRVQRGIVSDYGILEDFSNAEQINLYTVPYLINAGAVVLTVREMDHQTNMIIIDEEDGTSNPSNGTYVETGSWFASTLRGF